MNTIETMTSAIFSPTDLAPLNQTRIPRHIAIIPDGNRRWAKHHGKIIQGGHRAGANIIIDTVKAAKEIGVKTVTFYLFSTENWSRPKTEIAALMWLLKEFLINQCQEMLAHGVKLNTIGNLSAFAPDVREVIEKTREKTAHCDEIDMVLALNYGARDEIRRAVQKVIDGALEGNTAREEITEASIAKHLDTAPWGDPELLIRTSGEMRISNFLLWQLSYTELYVTDVLWPDFRPHHLLEAVIDFQQRDRRLGGK